MEARRRPLLLARLGRGGPSPSPQPVAAPAAAPAAATEDGSGGNGNGSGSGNGKGGHTTTTTTTQAFVAHYWASPHGQRQQRLLASCESRPPSLRASDWKANEQRRFRTTWWTALVICLRREATLTLRDRSYLRARLVQDVVLGLLTGLIYWDIGRRPGVAPTTVFGAIYQAVLTIAFQTAACIPAYFAQARSRILNRYMYMLSLIHKEAAANFEPVTTTTTTTTTTHTRSHTLTNKNKTAPHPHTH